MERPTAQTHNITSTSHRAHRHTHTHKYILPHTHTHRYILAHTHTHTHTHIYTRTHTHTHTATRYVHMEHVVVTLVQIYWTHEHQNISLFSNPPSFCYWSKLATNTKRIFP